MIKRADASKISRERATKEQIAENFKRLAVDTDKKVQLKPSLLKIQKTLDGNTFGIIHENKTYYLKFTNKKGTSNPIDFKHLDGLNSTFGIEKHNSFEKAVNKMTFICEAQNNAHKLRLLLEKDENIIDDTVDADEAPKTKVTSDDKEEELLGNLDKEKAPADDMGGDMGGEAPADQTPTDTTNTGVESPAEISDEILTNIGDEKSPENAPAADMGGETPAADMGGEAPEEAPAADMSGEAPEEAPADDMGGEKPEEAPEVDTKKEFQEAVGKIGQVINDLQDKDQFDEKDIKNAMNSLISAIGPEGFKMVGDKTIESFYKKMQGSQESVDNQKEEAPIEEPAAEEPAAEKLDENFLKELKLESKRLLKEQLQKELEKRKRTILIENIKRKLN